MNNLLTAIVDDNRGAVKTLLKADGGLATRLIRKPKLYRSKIFHWIYAGDTALHGAAGKGFVSVIQLLADRGAKLDAKNQSGRTPLGVASGEGKLDLFGMPVPEGQISPALKKAQELLRKLGATN